MNEWDKTTELSNCLKTVLKIKTTVSTQSPGRNSKLETVNWKQSTGNSKLEKR